MISKVRQHPNFNLGQLNAYKLMFAMKFSMEKQIKFLDCWIFSTHDKCNCLQSLTPLKKSPPQDFISRNFGEFQGEISLCCVLFSCLFFYPLALGIEQGNGMSARYVRILFGIKGDTFTPLSFQIGLVQLNFNQNLKADVHLVTVQKPCQAC